MAVVVVELLEVVDVDEHEREMCAVTTRALEFLFEPRIEGAPVRDARQRIVLSLVAELAERSRDRPHEPNGE